MSRAPIKSALENTGLVDTSFNISSVPEDHDGELVIVDYGGGVYQLVNMP